MSDYDYHPAVLASDTIDLQAGTLTRISDAIRMGAPSAAISGALSIYNTFLDYGNFLGTTDKQQVDTEAAIRGYDENWGDYYAENTEAIDMVGFVGSSLVPGTLGIKGLQLARAGNSMGVFSRALKMPQLRRQEYLEQAMQEVAKSGGTMKSILDVTRRKELLWGTADQAIMATAAELAIVGTMNDSTVFEGDDISDFGWNVALGTALGGTIGGALSGIASRGILKTAQKEVQAQLRMADTVFAPSKMGMLGGSEALLTAESIIKLADELPNLRFNYTLDGVPQAVELQTAGAVKNAAEAAKRSGMQDLALTFNRLAGDNANVGQAYFQFLTDGIAAAKAAGKDGNETLGLLNGWLANVQRIDGVDLDALAVSKNKFYVDLNPTGSTDIEKLGNLFSTKRTATTAKGAYRLADDVVQSQVVIRKLDDLGEATLRSAYRNNPDVDMIQLPDGSLRVNPESMRVLRVDENPFQFKQFIDLESGSMSSETVPVFGDIITKAGVQYGKDYVSAGGRTFRQAARVAVKELDTPVESSARWAWAASLQPKQLLHTIGSTVDLNDLPMLARLVELESDLAQDTLRKLKFVDGDRTMTFDDIVDLRQLLDIKRYDTIRDRLTEVGTKGLSAPDARVLAAQLNTDRAWIEEAIERNFRPPKSTEHNVGRTFLTHDSVKPRNVQVTWNFGQAKNMLPEDAFRMNMGPMHQVTKELTSHYQYKIQDLVGKNAMNAVLETDAKRFWEADEALAQSANTEGAGASLFGAANAGYGERAKLWAQDTGKNVGLVVQKRRDEVISTLAPNVNAIRQNLRASAELGVITNALRKSEFRYIPTKNAQGDTVLVAQDAYDFANKMKLSIEDAVRVLDRDKPGRSPRTYTLKEREVAEFLEASTGINAARQSKMTTLYNAAGLTRELDPRVIYVPPVNTVKYPFHAFVRTKQKVGLTSDVTMINARSEEQLRGLAAKVGDDFEVIYKADTEKYFKAKGEYDYEMTLHTASVNSEMARRGVLADFLPETRPENILTDWLEMHAKAEEKMVRTAVQVGNRRFFNEMGFLSEQYRKVSESVTRGVGSKFKSKVADPFGDYVKTALNISKQQEFPLLDSLNDFIDKVGLAAGEAFQKAFSDARKGVLSWEEANTVLKDHGYGQLFRDEDAYLLANEKMPRNVIRQAAQKVNMALATTLLRFDFANSLINIISTPILLGTEMQSLKGLIKGDTELAGKLKQLMEIKVPGRDASAPSTTRLLAESIGDFFGPDKVKLIGRYRDIGAVKDVSQLYHDMLDDLSFNPIVDPKIWHGKVDKAVETAAKLTGNTFSEDFTRFVSANVMRKLSDPLVEAGRLSIREQNAYISTFVNRVQGNYTTSQRPVVFQGTTGAAVSLFQTYAFNVLQQLYRHVEAGDRKTLAVFAGLQGSIFGLNGLPFFDAANTHIIGSWIANNPEHKDAYSVLPGFNKELGDWMLYGTASAFPLFTGSTPALYTRGDINPRHITILPTNFTDVPAVAASLKLFDAVSSTGKNIVQGGDVTESLLRGLEHQGWNRPLAGLAQLLGGKATTGSGALVSAASDMQTTNWLAGLTERATTFGGASRLFGARPMDEAVALNQLYRNKTYEAIDRQRVERLGQVVKTKLYNNQAPTAEEVEDFMLRYTRAGGDAKHFSQALQRWMKDANVSIVNQTLARADSAYAQKLKTIMGGEWLADYRNQPDSEADQPFME